MDLFEPGSGFTNQIHDYNGGIAPSGLFWTLRIPDNALSHRGNAVRLRIRNQRVVDSFQIFGPNEVPARVSYDITFTPEGPTRHLRPTSTDPLDPQNFAAVFRFATATGSFSGSSITEPGGQPFSFSGQASSAGVFAEMGFERNGFFLSHGDDEDEDRENAPGIVARP